MGNKSNSEAQSAGGFFLGFLKIILAWPVILGIFLLIHGGTIIEIAKSRVLEITPGGIKIGNLIEENTENQIDYLKEIASMIVANQDDPDIVLQLTEELAYGIQSLEQGLELDASLMAIDVDEHDMVTAEAGALDGFEFILDRNIHDAIDSFRMAESTWPEYHNVGEIRRLLEGFLEILETAPRSEIEAVWLDIYDEILSEYSWGMPEDIRTRFREKLDLPVYEIRLNAPLTSRGNL